MSRAECIVYINLSHGGKSLCKLGIVLLLLLVKADILYHHNVAVAQSRSLSLSILADNVLCHDDLFAEQL